jgi:hypothetical protein
MTTMKRIGGNNRQIFDKAMADLDAANVRIGWFESSKYPDKNQTPVAYVAAINELGPHARPFMRTTADEKDKDWSAFMLLLCRRIMKGLMTVEEALDALGLMAGADIQKKIAEIAAGGGLSLITLMARKARSEGKTVTGKTIGEFAAQIKKDEAAARAYASGIRDTPLNDTGYMVATLSSSVNNKTPKEVL